MMGKIAVSLAAMTLHKLKFFDTTNNALSNENVSEEHYTLWLVPVRLMCILGDVKCPCLLAPNIKVAYNFYNKVVTLLIMQEIVLLLIVPTNRDTPAVSILCIRHLDSEILCIFLWNTTFAIETAKAFVKNKQRTAQFNASAFYRRKLPTTMSFMFSTRNNARKSFQNSSSFSKPIFSNKKYFHVRICPYSPPFGT